MSPVYGNTAYYVCIADLVSIFGMYWYVKEKMDGKLVGSWRYRLWKGIWFITAIPCATLAINAAIRTFGGVQGVLEACFMSLYMIFSLHLTLQLNVDVLKVMTFLIFFFEALELTFMVFSIIGPKLAPKFFEKFKFLKSEQEYDELPEADIVPTVAAAST